jgi:hypothetical protein
MAGYVRALKKLDEEIRSLTDRLAQYRDKPGTSREAKLLYEQLQRKRSERGRIEAWLKEVHPDDLQWGPTAETDRIQEIMDRYRPGVQQELDLRGGAVPDNPFMQIDESMYTADPRAVRRGLPSDRAVPRSSPSQIDMFNEQRRIQREQARALRGDFDDAYADRDWV